jgi:FixJ family two-component response regulator
MIVVVDDTDSVRNAIIRILRTAGHLARGFASGNAFLETWPSTRFRCLILDLNMPGLSGVDVQRELHLAQARIPVIIMTPHDTRAAREECLRLGAHAFLTKPIDASVLLGAVAVALQSENGILA